MTRRIQVRITPETDKALDDYVAVSGGDSRSSVCAMFLHASIPALEAMTRTLATTENRGETLSREFTELLASALEDASQLDLDLDNARKGHSGD